jgi:hypothetical protein
MGPPARYRALIALLTIRGAEYSFLKNYIPEINKLSAETFKTGEARNRIVHDPWHYDRHSKTVAQFLSVPNSDKRYGIRERSIQDLEATLQEIKEFSRRADDLFNRINAEIKALHQKRKLLSFEADPPY